MVRAIVMSACVVVVGGSLAGCQPLYGGKAESPTAGPKKRPKPKEAEEAAVQIKYVEECTANFRDDPKNVRVDAKRSKQLVDEGETTLAQVPKAKGGPAEQADLIKRAIDMYRNALIKDPFNADATYNLAVAYDMVYRKGCALALLKRIAQLAANPAYASAARRVADTVADNNAVFKGYRNDAKSAVGR